MALPVLAFAQSADPKRWQLNMGQGVTPQSLNAYSAHMQVLWICVVIGITLYQERKTERALEALRDLSSPRALVVRGGERRRSTRLQMSTAGMSSSRCRLAWPTC